MNDDPVREASEWLDAWGEDDTVLHRHTVVALVAEIVRLRLQVAAGASSALDAIAIERAECSRGRGSSAELPEHDPASLDVFEARRSRGSR